MFVLGGSFDLDTVDALTILNDALNSRFALLLHVHILLVVAFSLVFLAYCLYSIASFVQLFHLYVLHNLLVISLLGSLCFLYTTVVCILWFLLYVFQHMFSSSHL